MRGLDIGREKGKAKGGKQERESNTNEHRLHDPYAVNHHHNIIDRPRTIGGVIDGCRDKSTMVERMINIAKLEGAVLIVRLEISGEYRKVESVLNELHKGRGLPWPN